jgi:hypothetical protein
MRDAIMGITYSLRVENGKVSFELGLLEESDHIRAAPYVRLGTPEGHPVRLQVNSQHSRWPPVRQRGRVMACSVRREESKGRDRWFLEGGKEGCVLVRLDTHLASPKGGEWEPKEGEARVVAAGFGLLPRARRDDTKTYYLDALIELRPGDVGMLTAIGTGVFPSRRFAVFLNRGGEPIAQDYDRYLTAQEQLFASEGETLVAET